MNMVFIIYYLSDLWSFTILINNLITIYLTFLILIYGYVANILLYIMKQHAVIFYESYRILSL